MQIKIYTDGACIGNPGPGGWAAIILKEGNKNEIFADMYVFYKFIYRQKFGSHVVFDKKKLLIQKLYFKLNCKPTNQR